MEDDASRAEAVAQQPDSAPEPELLIPSFGPPSVPSTPTPTGTLSRLGFKSPTSPSAPAPAPVPGSPTQVSAITVVALLDKLVNMLEAVQDNQQRMEQRQADLEGAVRGVQGDVTRLSKTHVGTSNCVSKLLERSRKVSLHLKEVRERLDRQAGQVKRLEANHSHLLKRNHFKVLIFQEDNEIPTSVAVKDSLKTPQPSQYDAESTHPTPSIAGSIDTSRAQEEGLQSISLSSDEDESLALHPVGEMIPEDEEAMGLGTSATYERRADKFRRTSLKRVDSLKKAFSRQSIEKKMNQITTKIVPPEKREKIIKSLTPNHPKSPTAKSSSFKVSPMTFNVKKTRDVKAPAEDLVSTEAEAHVEIPPLGSLDGEIPLAEVHNEEGLLEEIQNVIPSTPESLKADLEINGNAPVIECEINGDRCAGLAVPENGEDAIEEEESQEKRKGPIESTPADSQIPTATTAVEQVS
ncbi:caveolae-associated protein 2-like [Brachionichthys hirsutus]|uniref:caveolae-associated protein 2-like n=1 Tax=Brachionichthys hirsutus TaxID=412623 RepID=UPI003604EDAC